MILRILLHNIFFFFNDTATTEIYTLSLHDALPISAPSCARRADSSRSPPSGHFPGSRQTARSNRRFPRSEEHTSELQSPDHLVCRLLLEKKKKNSYMYMIQSIVLKLLLPVKRSSQK